MAASGNTADAGLWPEHCHTVILSNHPQKLLIHSLIKLLNVLIHFQIVPMPTSKRLRAGPIPNKQHRQDHLFWGVKVFSYRDTNSAHHLIPGLEALPFSFSRMLVVSWPRNR